MTNITTFELNGRTYTSNETGTHCYTWPTGRKGERVRIKKADFEIARDLYNAEQAEALSTDEAFEEALREAEESLAIEEALEAVQEEKAQEKPKKTPRKRTPKNIGFRNTYGNHEVILTEKQVDFIHHLPDTCYWERGLDSAIWIDCLCDEIGGQFADKPMTVGAMISTLCEKGIGSRCKQRVNGKKCTSFALTELGKLVAKDLGL